MNPTQQAGRPPCAVKNGKNKSETSGKQTRREKAARRKFPHTPLLATTAPLLHLWVAAPVMHCCTCSRLLLLLQPPLPLLLVQLPLPLLLQSVFRHCCAPAQESQEAHSHSLALCNMQSRCCCCCCKQAPRPLCCATATTEPAAVTAAAATAAPAASPAAVLHFLVIDILLLTLSLTYPPRKMIRCRSR